MYSAVPNKLLKTLANFGYQSQCTYLLIWAIWDISVSSVCYAQLSNHVCQCKIDPKIYMPTYTSLVF